MYQAVKNETVIEGASDLNAAGSRVNPVFLTFSKADKIGNGTGCFIVMQQDTKSTDGIGAVGYCNVGIDLCLNTAAKSQNE
jgi:hypothetical protein